MKIKICGLTDADEIDVINKLKPDYAGFVFAESKRKVTKEEVQILIKLLDKDIKVIGVFRNNSREFIEDILKDIPLYAIQLHGDEDIDFIDYFNKIYSCKVWKGESIESKKDLEEALKLPVSTLILDGRNPGSGKTFSWEYLKDIKTSKEILLAGGINENNIKEAVKIKNIQGIDVSSGVESIVDGVRRKDPYKIEKIIKEVREKHER